MSFAYLPLFTGDYLRDTQHLSMSEHGAYLKLLMHCWDQKGPAPLDERKLMGIVNARSTDEIEALRRVLGEFFVRMDDGFYNPRMQREIEKTENLSSIRSAAGRMGYEARAKHLPSKSQASASNAEEAGRQASAKQVHLSPSPSPSLSPSSEKDDSPIGELSRSPAASGDRDEAVAVASRPKATGYQVPDCPYQVLVELYHENLPAGRRCEEITDARKRAMQARWRHVCASEKLDRASGISWFADFFAHAGKSKFLGGQVAPLAGRKTFQASIDFLMNPQRFIEIYEGKYHR